MDVQAWLAERIPPVDAALEAWLPAAHAPPASLHAAMRHLVFPGGKRLRPALAWRRRKP
jgi:geranylgeranyl pyrophosphate synthase